MDRRDRNKAMVEWRMAEQRMHDCQHFAMFLDLPFELWPDAAVRSYMDGMGHEELLDRCEPTAAELRAILAFVLGEDITVVPEMKEQLQ